MNLALRARRRRGWLAALVLLAATSRAGMGLGQGGEVVGVITELKSGRGLAEIRPVGESEWRPVAPLQAVRPGDIIRVTEDAWTAILLTGDQGSVVVDTIRSPYRVPVPRSEKGKLEKARELMLVSLRFLRPAKSEPVERALVTRSEEGPPTIVTPRNGPVLPGPLTIDWSRAGPVRYTLRIIGPDATVVLERVDLGVTRFEYPPGGPALTPGVRYTVQINTAVHPAQEAWFEVLDSGRARMLEADLRDLEGAFGPAVSSSTRATVRAGFLASHGLIHDARRTLLLAAGQDPDEPAFHVMLGHLYEVAGLKREAAAAFDTARSLLPGTADAPAGGRARQR
ncbi:MAG: hypothetical protein HYW16_03575 [Candidatus Rokubacteria bacterium]|nr:hypothetical protein [Candidatus Rokubacteria bacterium]